MSDAFTAADHQLLLQELARRRLDLYRPYPKQMMFHAAGATYRERLLRAGNQCLVFSSYIDCPDSKSRLCGDIFFDTDSSVLAWGGDKECIGRIEQGHLKGIEPAFRVVLDNGQFFDCSSSHQVLSSEGYISLYELSVQSGGHRLWQKAEDYRANCKKFGYFYDGQLPSWLSNAQSLSPLLSDVRKHSLCWSLSGALGRIPEYIHSCLASAHLPISGHEDYNFLDLFSRFPVPYVPQPSLPLFYDSLKFERLPPELFSLLRSGISVFPYPTSIPSLERLGGFFDFSDTLEPCISLPLTDELSLDDQFLVRSIPKFGDDAVRVAIFFPFAHIPLVGGKNIVSIVYLGYQPIIDCRVPDVNNYKAAGVYHHNCGKTLAAAAETAMHASGKYPPYWNGHVFKKAPVIWCAGVTGEVVRDSIQRLLLGDVANPGTGFIPPEDIVEIINARGVANLADTILVKHQTGGTTRLRLKYYEQGREKFQADTVNFGWADEEPPSDIYSEMLTRTNATNGIMCMTFTPLKGMSEVVRRFLHERSPDRIDINMTIDDALHIPKEQRDKIIASYPSHERAARINGQPVLGSGRIFPIADDDIACDPFPTESVPFFWMEIAGMDFGWDHPTAAVRALYNPQDDIIYITNTYKRKEATPVIHAAALRSWGKNIPFAWPHDGLQHDKGSGEKIRDMYVEQGLNMLGERATFEDGSNGVEAGIAEMLMRMETGRWKVFRHLTDWFEEFRLYHRKEGKIFKEYEDLLAASRYLLMSLRYAARVRAVSGTINGWPISESDLSPQHKHTYKFNAYDRAAVRQVGQNKKT